MSKAVFDEKKFLKNYWHFLIPDTIARSDSTIFTHARGCELFNAYGRRWLDFSSQVGIANIGHHHPFFVRAWLEYMRTIYEDILIRGRPAPLWMMIASDFHFRFEARVGTEVFEISQPALAERLSHHAFGSSTKFIKSITGANINCDAIKFVQKLTRRPYGLAFYGGFHGRMFPALDATRSKAVQREGFFLPGLTHHLIFPQTREEFDCDMRILSYLPLSDYGYVIYECVQGEGGINPANKYTIELLEFLRDSGILLIDDEVQTGFGRTGKMFGYQHFSIVPDIVTISKSMGSGDPIAAAFFDGNNPRLRGYKKFGPGSASSTFQWNPHSVFSAIFTDEIIRRENLVERSASRGEYLGTVILHSFESIFSGGMHADGRYVVSKGIGLHRGVEFRKKTDDGRDIADPETRNAVLKRLFANGIATLGAGNSAVNPTIRFMPPLVIGVPEIDEFGDKFMKSLKEVFTP